MGKKKYTYEEGIRPRKLLISGHRGFRAGTIDNSKNAFLKAIEVGLDFIEFDVRTTSDGVPVVFHDRTVDALTDGHGRIEEMKLKDVKKLKYADGTEILTLEELFDICAGKIGLMMELKSGGAERIIADLIEKYVPDDKIMIQSFRPALLKALYAVTGDCGLCYGINLAYTGNAAFLTPLTARLTYKIMIKPYLKFLKFIHPDGPFMNDSFAKLTLAEGLFTVLGAKSPEKYIHKFDIWGVKMINCDDPIYTVRKIMTNAPGKYIFSEKLTEYIVETENRL